MKNEYLCEKNKYLSVNLEDLLLSSQLPAPLEETGNEI